VTATRPRLAAPERRSAILETACRSFSGGSYRGTTTAEIAREAGVTEPILYRHFASKRELYLAVLQSAWDEIRTEWDRIVTETDASTGWIPQMHKVALSAPGCRAVLADLWVQSLSEAYDDPEIRRFLRRQVREVHDYVADVIRRAQDAGAAQRDRDAEAEAWIFLSVGLLVTVGRRLGGVLSNEDLERIRTSRRTWMTGTSA
jgi:TetR/AcrR family transcriptional regulator